MNYLNKWILCKQVYVSKKNVGEHSILTGNFRVIRIVCWWSENILLLNVNAYNYKNLEDYFLATAKKMMANIIYMKPCIWLLSVTQIQQLCTVFCFLSQLFVRPRQTAILLFLHFFSLGMVLIPVSCTVSFYRIYLA